MIKTRPLMTLAAALVLATPLAHAQPAPRGEIATASSPGKFAAAAAVEVTATVTAIDLATRTVTLTGPQGRAVEVVAGEQVKNLPQVKVGDRVIVQYVEALSLELKKITGKPGAAGRSGAVTAAPGQRPGVAAGQQVVILADVVAVDPAKSLISLKGPKGNVVDLRVKNPDHFKVVRVGDQVEAIYSQAIAVAVRPAPKEESKAAPK